MSDDEDPVEKERREKWRMKGDEVEDDDRCKGCIALEEIIADLKYELDVERQAAEETIVMVKKQEDKHKTEIELLNVDLNLEKDKVVALTNTLDHERKARMQEIYKIERKSLEHEHDMKEFSIVNAKNRNLGDEYEAIKNENETLLKITEELQLNKKQILDQLQIYENQITELEKKNENLRKRLYDSDNEKDRHKVLAARMKQRLQDYMNGKDIGGSKVRQTRGHSLGPLKSKASSKKTYLSRAEGDSIFEEKRRIAGMTHLSQPSLNAQDRNRNGMQLDSHSSILMDTRLRSSQTASVLSSVSYIQRFNSNPTTISNSKKKNPMLWPVPY